MKQILPGILKNATPLKAPEFAILRSFPHLLSNILKNAKSFLPLERVAFYGTGI
jgi:hypothetical protein